MNKFDVLSQIFENDEFNILNVKPKTSVSTENDRLFASFEDINNFYREHNREPEENITNISEYKLYIRLKGIREEQEKIDILKPVDKYNLLEIKKVKKEINSLDDLLNDSFFNSIDQEEKELFNLKHIPKTDERANADFVARREPCKNFDKYKKLFEEIQKDLKTGKRKLVEFKEENLKEGSFHIYNGVLIFLEEFHLKHRKHGERKKKDGRTKCIFENGTKSNMYYQSLSRTLYVNGKTVSDNFEYENENFLGHFSHINENDEESGYIYILSSGSEKKEINSIKNLYKIGFSTTDVEKRVKNARNEATYLMADVKIEAAYKCFNMNPQKLENLLHKFFGNYCLDIEIFDAKGKKHHPREWFIVPFNIIEEAIKLIITERIVDYEYNGKVLVKKDKKI